jgi:uncharacterized protein (TIRG00374 family)
MSSPGFGLRARRLGRLAVAGNRSSGTDSTVTEVEAGTGSAVTEDEAESNPPGDGERERRKGRYLRFVPKPLRHALLIFLTLLTIEYFGVPALLNAKASLSLLRHVNVFWMIAGLGAEAGALLAYAFLTRTVLPPDGPSLWTLFRIDMSTLAVNHVLPGGTASSSGLGYRLLTSHGVNGPDAAFAMGTQGIGSAVVLNVLLWFALVISIPIDGAHRTYVTVALVGVLLLLIFAALIYLLTKGEAIAARVLRTVARPIPRLSGDRVEAVVRQIGARLRILGADRALLRSSLSWASANWLLDAASLWCFVAAFGRFLSPVDLFVAYGVGNVLAAIPLTPGGLGLVEAASTGALVGFGLTRNIASLAVIGWRLVNFWLPIPVGAGMYVSLRVERGLRHLRGREALAELRTMPDLATPMAAEVDPSATPLGTSGVPSAPLDGVAAGSTVDEPVEGPVAVALPADDGPTDDSTPPVC